MSISLDPNLLLGYYQSRNGPTGLTMSAGSGAAKRQYAPTAPWSTRSTAPHASELVKSAMTGRRFVDENAAKLDLQGASNDYKKLFALYQGLNTLSGLADQAAAKRVAATDLTRLQKTFERGLAEVGAYADGLQLDQLRLTRGDTVLSDKTAVGVPKPAYDYVTPTLFTGTVSDVVPAFAGAAAFNLSIVRQGITHNITVDLSDLGSTPRTIGNVVNYINTKLQAEGVVSRFAVERTKGEPRTVLAGGKTITLPAVGDAFALKVKGDSGERLTFSAAARPAVYVTTRSGNPDPDKDIKTDDGVFQNSLLKIDPAGATAPETRISTANLEGTVGAVHASQTGPDGRLYLLADVSKTIDGQPVKGDKDVALLSYDSAGKLIFARTLGAVDNATGLGLAVSADGKVAITGAVSGELSGATEGPLNSTAASGKTDSFVTLYDKAGAEVWTVRRGALEEDEATAVTFGADGLVYVAGRTKSGMPGGTAQGGWDSYLTAYSTTDQGAPKALFTQQFGTANTDAPAGIVVDGGKLTVASSENGSAVLRSFDVTQTETRTIKTWASGVLTTTVETWTGGALANSQSTLAPTPGAADATTTTSYISSASLSAGATRNLGDLQGGALTGLKEDAGQLYLAGYTRNAALSAGSITRAHAGGLDAFAMQMSTDLSSTAGDALAYYGGAGDNTVTGMDVAGGKVFLTGAAGADLPGLTAAGQKDGYLAELDVAAGSIVASQRLTGKDGIATATTVAVDLTGASDLDKFGLPAGTIDYTRSPLIVSATAARPGDSFQLRTKAGGHPSTITIDAKETLETLATKIKRVTGFSAKVEVLTSGGSRILKISPRNDNATIEVMPGKNGRNVLDAIGLTEGVVRNTDVVNGKAVSTAPGGNIYGLGLRMDMSLTTADEIKRAQSVIGAALSKIRAAYRDLEAAAKPPVVENNFKAGAASPYLQAQLANYQAGLNRLNGGF